MAATNHVIYDNFILSNEIEDQLNSKLNLQNFVTVDNKLVGVVGDTVKINVYNATDGTEKLAMGEGNTKTIEVKFAQKEYTIGLAQNRFDYYDEQAMKDALLVPTGMKHAATDMYNTINADVYAEFNKATLTVNATEANFDAFVDAAAKINLEDADNNVLFAIAHTDDVAAIRKSLKDTLQYVEAYVRTGYIGTVAGINIYAKKDATKGTIIVASKQAVTIFNKRGVEVEQSGFNTRSAEDANIRLNSVFSRKYYVAALTDASKAVKIVVAPGA